MVNKGIFDKLLIIIQNCYSYRHDRFKMVIIAHAFVASELPFSASVFLHDEAANERIQNTSNFPF